MSQQSTTVGVQDSAGSGKGKQKQTPRNFPAEEWVATLRDYLTALGVSRTELARRTGISPSTMANYGSGRDKPPPEAVIAIEDALGTGTGALLSLFGFARTDGDGTFRAPGVLDAIATDPRLSDEDKAALVGLYRILSADD